MHRVLGLFFGQLDLFHKLGEGHGFHCAAVIGPELDRASAGVLPDGEATGGDVGGGGVGGRRIERNLQRPRRSSASVFGGDGVAGGVGG